MRTGPCLNGSSSSLAGPTCDGLNGKAVSTATVLAKALPSWQDGCPLTRWGDHARRPGAWGEDFLAFPHASPTSPDGNPASRWPSPCRALSPRFERTSGWQAAEAMGDATPDRMPRRLSRVDGRSMLPGIAGRPSGARPSVTLRGSASRPSRGTPSPCGSPPGVEPSRATGASPRSGCGWSQVLRHDGWGGGRQLAGRALAAVRRRRGRGGATGR
jgi:hypothetical protein